MLSSYHLFRGLFLDRILQELKFCDSVECHFNLKSNTIWSFEQVAGLFNITTSDPASTVLQNLEHFVQQSNSKRLRRLQNPNAVMLGLNKRDFHNQSAVREFIRNIVTDFEHLLITEHIDESLIVMRRKLCWHISDIFYLSQIVGHYDYKNTQLGPDLVQKLTNWSRVDSMLYKTFNETLWKNVAQYGEDFWDEVKFYKNQKERIFKFCSLVLNSPGKYFNISNLDEHILVPKSPWGNEFKIDNVWCMINQMTDLVLQNTIRVKEYPELCSQTRTEADIRDFHISRTDLSVVLHPDHCSSNKTSSRHTFQLPVPILMDERCYL